MLQVKFIYGTDLADLNESLNKALSTTESETKPDIKYDFNKIIAVIEYETHEAYKDRLCCDCTFWDDSVGNSDLIGMCQMCGKRKRFNDKACPRYEDIRA